MTTEYNVTEDEDLTKDVFDIDSLVAKINRKSKLIFIFNIITVVLWVIFFICLFLF